MPIPSDGKTVNVPFHPLADLFPLMTGVEFDELVADIKQHGLREPIVKYEEKILDGRNRYRACRAAGVEPVYAAPFAGNHADALAFVISANIHRRHLTPEQKRDLIAKLLKASPEKSDRQIAKVAKVHNETVAAVRKTIEGRDGFRHVDKRTDTKGRQQPATRARRGERHVCWQCRARDEVGKVEKHHYAEYEEDCDVWLHPACVADFEKSLAADRKPADDQPTDVEGAPSGELARPIPDVQPAAPKPKLDPLPSLRELRALRASATKETDPLKPAKDAMAALCWLVLAASDPRLVEHLPTVVAEKLGVSAANDIDRVIALLTDLASRLRAKEAADCVVELTPPPHLAPIPVDYPDLPTPLDRSRKLN